MNAKLFLFLGKELFVGISKFTNEAGALFLANTFPELPVSPVQVQYKLFLFKHYSLWNIKSFNMTLKLCPPGSIRRQTIDQLCKYGCARYFLRGWL